MQRIVALLVLSLAAVRPADAATLTTGGLLGKAHRCCVANAGTKALTNVVPRLRSFDGTSAGGTNLCTDALQPGELCCVQRSATTSDVLFCSIAFYGRKTAVRGTLAVESGGDAQAVVEAR
jgi:hypothetical protein